MRCILCGKEYKRQVTDAHLKSHSISRKKYGTQAKSLTEAEWEFYWTHPGLRNSFPDPTAKTATDGELTYSQWTKLPKIQAKHPELAGE